MSIATDNYVVYMHTTPSNKRYIGITKVGVSRRWCNGIHYKKQLFGKAIKKYGWENIKHEILFEKLSEKEAKQKERELIKQYKSNDRHYGYNLTEGGDGFTGMKLTEEHRKNISLGKKGQIPHNKGKKMSEAQRQRIIETRRRKKVYCYTNGKTYNSLKETAEQLNIDMRYISAVCRKVIHSTFGYKFEYVKEGEQ